MNVESGGTRPAVLAGQFYPADPGALARMVDDCLAAADNYPGQPKAVIAPHAGFVYSGPIAGTAYAAIRWRRAQIRRVVMLGPCHRVPVRQFAVPRYDAFETPLGKVPLDREGIAAALRLPGVEQRDDAHLPEHCLETQLPFLQRLLDDFTILPILVGAATPEATAALLEALWGGEETLVVISSDFSHFHDYETAQRLDTAACHAIEVLDPASLGEEQACGRHAIRGLLTRAQALDLRATTLDLRNSGDTAGKARRESVVGYGALAFEDAATARTGETARRQLLETAAGAIAGGLRGNGANGKGNGRGGPPTIDPARFPWPLRAIRASFVTLKAGGELRGCVGSATAHQPLIADVAASAYRAAFGDRRFEDLSREEFLSLDGGLELSISILSRPRPLAAANEADALAALQPQVDGVILKDGEHGALFLPQVWASLPEPRDFLARLKLKAGLAEDHWSDGLQLFRFRTESFGTQMKARQA